MRQTRSHGKSAELQPAAAATHRWQALIAAQRGDGEAALREAQLEPDEGYRRFELAVAQYVRGDRKAADAALADLIANGRDRLAYQIAEVYAVRGEKDKAFEWLQISFDDHDAGTLSLLVIRCCAACAMILDTRTCSPNSVYLQRHECKTFFVLRAKTTQRVQGCSDLCRGGVAAD